MTITASGNLAGMQGKASNPLKALNDFGQSVWLDYIRRSLITSGELRRMIDADGLRGVTSNPAIFEKAITGSTDYSETLKALESEKELGAAALYERLAVKDIQDAADVLRPVYDQTKGRDGYVSLEVSPYLAHETKSTVEEAHRLWTAVGRDNVMIKVPATKEGIPAIEQLIGEGINVNVTLLFSEDYYTRVAEAYISGLEKLATGGGDVGRMASVASFFISRIDTKVDALLEARVREASDPAERELFGSLAGKVAIANGRLTYQRYKEIFSGTRWDALAAKGARSQRVLWASTSTKNPRYRDVQYVEELIGADTVNTIPPATYDAFREHGGPRPSLEEDIEGARSTMETLAKVGISMEDVTEELLDDGLRQFSQAFDKLLNAVDKRCVSGMPTEINPQIYRLPADLTARVDDSLQEWQESGRVRRLWGRDASLWTDTDENKWLGWLGLTEDQMTKLGHLEEIADDVKDAGFTHALLLGMGGSSLCPEVMKRTFGKIDSHPELFVLDSTDPAQVRAFAKKVDLARTLFIVSSKSGATLEPNIFKQYFYDRVKDEVGAAEAGSRFIAVTDPGSKLQEVAESEGFRRIFFGWPSVGGRYSAVSNFGMVPAAIQGVDVARFLDRVEEMVQACASCVPAKENPGIVLGTILGVLAKEGRDKVTIITSPGISDFGAWLEQLLAESTGKKGKGLIPVDREVVGPPEVYGQDRVFVYLRLEPAPDGEQDRAVAALEQADQPVVRIGVNDVYDLGQEFFRWEIATAVAGSQLGINAFNQPDVEASKVATKKLTSEYEQKGALPGETPVLEDKALKLFTDEKNARALAKAAGEKPSVVDYLRAHLDRLQAGDYFALLAYVEMNEAHEALLQELRHVVRDRKRVATCLGFGPRFLHSTGQAYKGGPNTGVFVQVTCDDAADLQVPGKKYTFGVVKAAQARGDFEVLAQRGRRALRVHIGSDVHAGLDTLRAAIVEALK